MGNALMGALMGYGANQRGLLVGPAGPANPRPLCCGTGPTISPNEQSCLKGLAILKGHICACLAHLMRDNTACAQMGDGWLL